MNWIELLTGLFTDYTLRIVALGAGTLGLVSGALGAFAVLRKQSLMGDAMSHAALPGVVLAFLLTRSKEPLVLLAGAAVSGLLGTLWMLAITRTTRIKEDAALGMVLSVFFGFGLMLLTFTQRLPDARQAGLDQFLFGQAAALLERDVLSMAILGGVVLLLLTLFWKELKLLSFDRDYAASLGFPVTILDVLLTGLLTVAIVIGLQAVGVVLMSAMIIAPAAAARQWSDRLGWMVALSGLFGALAGVGGTLISSLRSGLSTGPTIVLVASGIMLFSLFFAGNRGLVWNRLRYERNRRSLQTEMVLEALYELAAQHGDLSHPHALDVLRVMNHQRGGISRSLETLAKQGLVQTSDTKGSLWALTPQGVEMARKLAAGRQG